MDADDELTTLADGGELMTLPEGAALLRVSKSTIYRLVKARTLEHYKIPGGQMLVDRRQIRKLMQASIVPAVADRVDVAS